MSKTPPPPLRARHVDLDIGNDFIFRRKDLCHNCGILFNEETSYLADFCVPVHSTRNYEKLSANAFDALNSVLLDPENTQYQRTRLVRMKSYRRPQSGDARGSYWRPRRENRHYGSKVRAPNKHCPPALSSASDRSEPAPIPPDAFYPQMLGQSEDGHRALKNRTGVTAEPRQDESCSPTNAESATWRCFRIEYSGLTPTGRLPLKSSRQPLRGLLEILCSFHTIYGRPTIGNRRAMKAKQLRRGRR